MADNSRELWDPRTQSFDPDVLRAAMIVRGLSLADLSRRSKVGMTTLYRVLKGERLHMRTIAAIHGALSEVAPKVVAA